LGKRRLGCPKLSICTVGRIPNLWINTKKIKCFCSKQDHLCKAVRKGRRERRIDKKENGKRPVGSRRKFKSLKSPRKYSRDKKSRRNQPNELLDPITYSPQEEAYSPQPIELYPKLVEENQPSVQVDSNVDPNEEPAVLKNGDQGKTFCRVLMDLPPRYRLSAIYTKGTVIQVNELIHVDEASGEVKFISDGTRISSLSCTEIDGIALGQLQDTGK